MKEPAKKDRVRGHIRKIAGLTGASTKDIRDALKTIGKAGTDPAPGPDDPAPGPDGPAPGPDDRVEFKLDMPESAEPADIDAEVLRCGNPACGKILNAEYNSCPFCGCNLEW